MKVTIDLSPFEIKKLGELTNSSFKYGWVTLYHTSDDICFAIHNLINMISDIELIDCNGECESCENQEIYAKNNEGDESDEHLQ